MTFKLSKTSLGHLKGIDTRLREVVREAILRTPVDFAVIDGLRTIEEQRELVAKKVSWTLNSKHLHGHAIDFVPYVQNKITWSPRAFVPVMDTIRDICREKGIGIRWGGCWSRRDIRETETESLLLDMQDYIDKNGTDDLDPGHIELVEK